MLGPSIIPDAGPSMSVSILGHTACCGVILRGWVDILGIRSEREVLEYGIGFLFAEDIMRLRWKWESILKKTAIVSSISVSRKVIWYSQKAWKARLTLDGHGLFATSVCLTRFSDFHTSLTSTVRMEVTSSSTHLPRPLLTMQDDTVYLFLLLVGCHFALLLYPAVLVPVKLHFQDLFNEYTTTLHGY